MIQARTSGRRGYRCTLPACGWVPPRSTTFSTPWAAVARALSSRRSRHISRRLTGCVVPTLSPVAGFAAGLFRDKVRGTFPRLAGLLRPECHALTLATTELRRRGQHACGLRSPIFAPRGQAHASAEAVEWPTSGVYDDPDPAAPLGRAVLGPTRRRGMH